NYMTTFTDCRQSSAIDIVPEPFDSRMRSPPFSIKLLYFFISESIGLKLSPCVDAAHVAKCQITDLADIALLTILAIGRVCDPIYPAGGDAVWLVARIAGGVVATIAVEFPVFGGNPGQDPAFNGVQVAAHQCTAGRGNNHRAAAVADDAERLGVEAAYVGVITGANGGDGGGGVFHHGAPPILRVKTFAPPTAGSRPRVF